MVRRSRYKIYEMKFGIKVEIFCITLSVTIQIIATHLIFLLVGYNLNYYYTHTAVTCVYSCTYRVLHKYYRYSAQLLLGKTIIGTDFLK